MSSLQVGQDKRLNESQLENELGQHQISKQQMAVHMVEQNSGGKGLPADGNTRAAMQGVDMTRDGTSKLTKRNMRKKRSLDDAMANNSKLMHGVGIGLPAHDASYASLSQVFSTDYTDANTQIDNNIAYPTYSDVMDNEES